MNAIFLKKKTRVFRLYVGEEIAILPMFALIQYQRVTDSITFPWLVVCGLCTASTSWSRSCAERTCYDAPASASQSMCSSAVFMALVSFHSTCTALSVMHHSELWIHTVKQSHKISGK